MFYLLLILPHVLALAALLTLAACTAAGGCGGQVADAEEGTDDGGGLRPPPVPPRPLRPRGGLPLPLSGTPRRRLRVGERLRELHPARVRRGHPPAVPAQPAAPVPVHGPDRRRPAR